MALSLLPAAAFAEEGMPSDELLEAEEAAEAGAEAEAEAAPEPDPRVGLGPASTNDAVVGKAAWNMERLAHRNKAAPLTNTNSDLAFLRQDGVDYAISGNYNGFTVYDVTDPTNPVTASQYVCPGSQNDVSVYGDLLFLSVEATGGKIDCTSSPAATAATRFRGVRIFDISDVNNPQQLPGIQTCRGSHTHTVVSDPDDDDNVYVYVSGTAGQRSSAEFVHTPDGFRSGRCGQTSAAGANPSQWMIEVIKVPLDAPETASVVNEARLFQNFETGAVNGLQNGPTRTGHPCSSEPAGSGFFCSPAGTGYSPTPNTNTCHDITSYPELGLAAGACQGNGILIDITDPANPVRIDAVADENFSYWHSATLNNDGTKVVFTDEWAGGGGARCMANHRVEWGANALFDIVRTEDGLKMEFASYYKLPAPQTAQENCVAHNGNLVPVPGRDIMVQAWYQGGNSVFDFTDTANPKEIAFFDYAPNSAASLVSGGFWSTYWWNGNIYGNEIARGFDTFALTESDDLNAIELAAADQVDFDQLNAQHQERNVWPATFLTVRAWHSAAQRAGVLSADADANLTKFVDRAEAHSKSANATLRNSAAANLRAVANQLGGSTVEAGLADALRELAPLVGNGKAQ